VKTDDTPKVLGRRQAAGSSQGVFQILRLSYNRIDDCAGTVAAVGHDDRLLALETRMSSTLEKLSALSDTPQQLSGLADSLNRVETWILEIRSKLGIDVSSPAVSSTITFPAATVATTSSIESPLLALQSLTMRDTPVVSSAHSPALSTTNSSVRSGK
jgi:hypothetical protein